ncbi:MAG TPA: histidinol-phosphate transaminase [Candidatus Tyrphobacter sp.]
MFEAYQRGTSIEEVRRRFGALVEGRAIVKLASNENPLGSSPKALDALRSIESLNVYVDDAYLDVKARLASRHALAVENVVLGHGSNEIVRLAAETFLGPGDEAVTALPTFTLYRLAIALRGAVPVEVPLRDGVTDLSAMLAAITPRTRLVYVCDPNNPTGTGIDDAAWRAFLKRLPPEIVLVVDQAYREYAPAEAIDAIADVRLRPRTLVLRTMSKIYGLAALRFGYGFADDETIGRLERVRLPFNVAAPALAGASAALDDAEFVARGIAANEAGKALVLPALEGLGLDVYPTQANFYAVAVPTGASRAYEDLLRMGIIVRSGDALRMPGRLRITIGTQEQNRALLAAFEELLPRWRG